MILCLRRPSVPMPALLAATALGLTMPAPARAQLIRDEVRGNERVCTYYGSDILPNDQVVAREFVVGLAQGCPATAPYHDPNAPAPANARLMGETTGGGNRVCLYEQGGVEYQLTVSATFACAMTPALLDRVLAGTR